MYCMGGVLRCVCGVMRYMHACMCGKVYTWHVRCVWYVYMWCDEVRACVPMACVCGTRGVMRCMCGILRCVFGMCFVCVWYVWCDEVCV